MSNKIIKYTANVNIPVFVQFLILTDILLCILFLGDYAIGRPSYKLSDLLNLDSELSVADWYSSTKFFCMFLFTAIIWYYNYMKYKTSVSLALFPLIFLAMSIDDSAHVHEYLGWQLDALMPGGSRENTTFSVTGIWMFAIDIPFILLFFWIIYSIKDFLKNSRYSFKRTVIGATVLLGGALGVESLSNFVEGGLLVIQITVEEGMEMIGDSILIWSVYDLSIENLTRLICVERT